MSTHQTTVILPSNNPWFDAPDVMPPEDVDPCLATLAFRRTRRKEFKVGLGEELVLGRRHSTHSIQPDIDLNEYNAMAYGVSRLHAKLRHEEYGWWMEDLSSANGTWVNGERLEPYAPVSLGIKNQIILSTFQFYLFLPSKIVSGVSVPAPEAKQPMHVVNIEDDRDLQRLMAMAFKESEPSINLQQFVSGDQALPYIMQHKDQIDLFVIDIMLPGKYNGIEIAQQIRQMNAPGYISLTSAFAEPTSDLLTELRAEFFPKPLHILDIIPRLASYRLTRSAISAAVAARPQPEPVPVMVPQPPAPRPHIPERMHTSEITDPIGPFRRQQTSAPRPYHGDRTTTTHPAAHRPSIEFESLESLGAPVPEPAYAGVGAGSAHMANAPHITPLPSHNTIQPLPPPKPTQTIPTPRESGIKLNVIQRLISKLRGL
ncbi:MAG: FHA domain-containing protein [Anaerolineae bacterium]|nr:FHA domain-containing protein [Anaerolineae bacterium]